MTLTLDLEGQSNILFPVDYVDARVKIKYHVFKLRYRNPSSMEKGQSHNNNVLLLKHLTMMSYYSLNRLPWKRYSRNRIHRSPNTSPWKLYWTNRFQKSPSMSWKLYWTNKV